MSDERVSLPDGPGSIGGVGENVEVDPNMALMRYSVPIEIPPGFKMATPGVGLSYSSGSGSSLVGIGWDVAFPAIERATFRGLPEYTQDDLFAVNGGDELVRVADGNTPTYRTRFEKAFVRYRWHGPGDGKAGYWTGEQPDGTTMYFGADSDGNAVETARVTTPDGGVFRYHLVESVDPYGHRVVYSYVKSGGMPRVSTIGYAFEGDEPRYSIRMVYEDRDDLIADARPGFELILDKRLTEIRILSRAEVIRKYVLEYEPYATSGGLSRLAHVTQFGRNDVEHKINFTFGYSKALGGTCDTDCEKPFVVDMGTLPGGVDIGTGRATLIDINGDSLPDVLSTDAEGNHTFIISELSPTGEPAFSNQVVESTSTTGGSTFVLDAPGVQVLDVNGDGFTDIVSSRVPEVLCNDGSGDWMGQDCIADATLPQLSDDADDADEDNPRFVRFFDYDNDKRIDMLRTLEAGGTEVYVNTGSAFEQTNIDDIGSVFDASPSATLQLADMNGDGLQDPVEFLGQSSLRYRTNLGYGKWSDWVEVTLQDFGAAAVGQMVLEDINGDSLADVVYIAGTELKYSLNNNGSSFDAIVTVRSSQVEGELPEKTASTTVVFADMNGNGSRDPVWITSNGNVKFLELFPVRPNLLSRIENGIGFVQFIEYGTSVAELARDAAAGRPWKYRLNHSMNVVKRTDTWVSLTGSDSGGLHEVMAFEYHDGFYDGNEKQFRGYADVERLLVADMDDDAQEAGLTVFNYDVGVTDPYYNGLQIHAAFFGGANTDAPIAEEFHEFSDCDVDGIELQNLTRDVRFICETATDRVLQEGMAEQHWATVRTEMAYDGYGQVVRNSELGVAHMGSPASPRACGACMGSGFGQPCGDDCRGDEMYTVTEYIDPGTATGGAWILGAPARELVFGEEGGLQRETQTFYDGPDFVGLGAGTLDKGSVTRVLERQTDGGALIPTERNAYDGDGNVVSTLDALGSPDSMDGHRRLYTYDSTGLNLTRAEILLDGYSLRQEVSYEEAFDKPSESTAWMTIVDGSPVTPRNTTRFRYDEQGRLIARLFPGDQQGTPTEEYVYELADPASRIIIKTRSLIGGAQDIEEIRCLDGRAREFQRRTRISDGRYLVDGFSVFNSRGEIVRAYEPYESDSDQCDTMEPSGVRFTAIRYDASGREILKTLPDADIHGSASTQRTIYEPLGTVTYDELDDEDGDFLDTPERVLVDGLGRTVAFQRFLQASGDGEITAIEYDSLSRLAAYTDADGNVHSHTYDLLDRVLTIDDPNEGMRQYEYDAQGNNIAHVDPAGNMTVNLYDGNNRILGHYLDGDEDGTRVDYRYDHDADCDDCSNAAGRLVSATYPLRATGVSSTGIDRKGYDGRGNTIYESRVLEGHRFDITSEYDNAARLVLRTFPDGQTIERTYDGAGRLASIPGVVNGITYDERGLVTERSYANGDKLQLEYDAMQRLAAQRSMVGGEVIHGRAFSRDRIGNITAVSDTSDDRDGAFDLSANYAYDAWYRVQSAELDTSAETPEKLSWTYDAIDNILSLKSDKEGSAAHVGDYEYGSRPGAVVKAGDREFGYDAAGRMDRRDATSLSWDYQDRLVSVASDDENLGEYVYGAVSERVMKLQGGGVTYYISNEYEVRDGIGVLYARDDRDRVGRMHTDSLQASLLEDGDEDGAITSIDAWLHHEDADFAGDMTGRLLRASARRMLLSAGDDKVYLHHDDSGSVTLATNDDGDIIGERVFYPTGMVQAERGYVDTYGYTGQEHDAESGLLHFEKRYLDPHISRWITPDPLYVSPEADDLGKREASARYTFVSNNPVNRIDENGLEGGPKGPKPKAKAKKAKASKGTSKSTKAAKSKTKPKAKASKAPGSGQGRIATRKRAKQIMRANKAGKPGQLKKQKSQRNLVKSLASPAEQKANKLDKQSKKLGKASRTLDILSAVVGTAGFAVSMTAFVLDKTDTGSESQQEAWQDASDYMGMASTALWLGGIGTRFAQARKAGQAQELRSQQPTKESRNVQRRNSTQY